ncbi:MAG: hemerythrin family protein [Alphaproteobacteria bacterium]|nr:hemerythrin family protein [Alphaproteobacteria bacterium]MBU6473605.1 hemerythrin family protein [Alphaproteobacteria bacterium]MDE2013962.1 hemerythrin family protein [Alphaproteobacteria bacterium]MDE2073779.1 hemerythrin family protein [Alphaproteobacteria bacterium]MDE2351043.1 hemerythrin family protein [Alphaproteobacteria bacterium]
MSIQWREGMTIDHGTIDHDHQTLIALINQFCDTPLDDAGMLELQRIFDRLDRYTAIHFQREEQLQRAANYPYREAHHREHGELIREMDGLRRKFGALVQTAGDLAMISAAPRPELARLHTTMAEFLRHWLVDHIVKSDLRMKPYAAEMARLSGSFAPLAKAAA